MCQTGSHVGLYQEWSGILGDGSNLWRRSAMHGQEQLQGPAQSPAPASSFASSAVNDQRQHQHQRIGMACIAISIRMPITISTRREESWPSGEHRCYYDQQASLQQTAWVLHVDSFPFTTASRHIYNRKSSGSVRGLDKANPVIVSTSRFVRE